MIFQEVIGKKQNKTKHTFRLAISFCEKQEVQAEDEIYLHLKQQNNWLGKKKKKRKKSLMRELAAVQVSQKDIHFLCSKPSQSLPELMVYCDRQKLPNLTSHQV